MHNLNGLIYDVSTDEDYIEPVIYIDGRWFEYDDITGFAGKEIVIH